MAHLMIIHADNYSPRANGEGWHSEVSYDPEPPMGSLLYITTCPPHGGDTLLASMYAAYEVLSDRMKGYLDGLVAVYDGDKAYRGTYQHARGAAHTVRVSCHGAERSAGVRLR